MMNQEAVLVHLFEGGICESMKKHTFCFGISFFLLPLHRKYDKSYSNGYRKSHKRA